MADSDASDIDSDEREEHKIEQRRVNSLGSILSGLGGGGDGGGGGGGGGNRNESPKANSDTNGSNTKYDDSNSVEPNNSGKRSYEIKKIIDNKPYKSTKAAFGWNAASLNMTGGDSSRSSAMQPEKEQGGPYDDGSKKPRLDGPAEEPYGNRSNIPSEKIDGWAETRRCNEDGDFDPVWLNHEHKKLDDMFGGGIVTVKYTDQNTLGYYCELCFATMNAMKPLEMHCGGMKHLRKKDLYEKSKAAGEKGLVELRKKDSKPLPPNIPKGPSTDKGWERDPYKSEQDYRSYGREPYSRDRDQYKTSNRPEPYGDRYRTDGDRYRTDGDRYRTDGDLYRTDADRYRTDADRYRTDADRYRTDADPYRTDADPYRTDANPYRTDADPYRTDADPHRTNDYRGGLRHPDDRPSPYAAERPRSIDYSHRRDDRSQSGGTSHRSVDAWDDRRSIPLQAPSPPPAKLPVPAPLPPVVEVETSLTGGPAAALLTKLAQCNVKNEDDATLASSVINLLLKSLKEYNTKLGEKSVADLMEQAEIKLGTAKAIRNVRKPVASSVPLDAISRAMDTLRRANAITAQSVSRVDDSSSTLRNFLQDDSPSAYRRF